MLFLIVGRNKGFARLKYRRSSRFRIHAEFVGESELVDAIKRCESVLGQVLAFTTVVEFRTQPRGYGFFVELSKGFGMMLFFLDFWNFNCNANLSDHINGEVLKESVNVIDRILSKNIGYSTYREKDINRPTLRIVSEGTFRAYRSRKIDIDSIPSSQVKVPMALVDPDVVDWLASRVVLDSHLLDE